MAKKTNKLPWIIGGITVVFVAVVSLVLVKVVSSSKPVEPDVETFSLSQEYYGKDEKSVSLEGAELSQLVEEKKSFVVYVSLPLCTEETAKFKEFVEQFQSEHHIEFYYMTSDHVKETPIYETVKYFPSVILYRDGELVKYLDFTSDEDTKYYKSLGEFSRWFETYVKLEK